MTLQEQMDKFHYGKDISRVRTEIINNIDFFKDPEFAFTFVKNIILEFKQNTGSPNFDIFTDMADKFLNAINHNENSINLNEEIEKMKSWFTTKIFNINIPLVFLTEFLLDITNPSAREVEIQKVDLDFRRIGDMLATNSNSNAMDLFLTELSHKHPDYDYYFAMTLRQTAIKSIHDFLEYHREKHNGNFEIFLNEIILEWDDLLTDTIIKRVKDWMESNEQIEQQKADLQDTIIPIIRKTVQEELGEQELESKSKIRNENYLTADEAAEYMNISKSTVYKLSADKKLPKHKPGKNLLFFKADLDAWIENHRRKSKYEIDLLAEEHVEGKKKF